MTKSDFPHTHREFVQEFPNGRMHAQRTWEQLRWPEGFCLPCLSDSWSALASDAWSSGLFCMSPPDIRDNWNNPGEKTRDTPYDLV